jgi:hypothetical protein
MSMPHFGAACGYRGSKSCCCKRLIRRCLCMRRRIVPTFAHAIHNAENKSQGMFVGGNQAKGLTGSILLSILMTADVRFSGLCRWWVPGESRVGWYWRCDRGSAGRKDQNCQVDRAPGQQCRRVSGTVRSAAMRVDIEGESPPRLLRFRSRGTANDRAVPLSESETLFPALDLPEIDSVPGLLHLLRAP